MEPGSVRENQEHPENQAVFSAASSPRTAARSPDAAARDLTRAAAEGAVSVAVARTYPLAEIAAAHELVESGSAGGRVLVALP